MPKKCPAGCKPKSTKKRKAGPYAMFVKANYSKMKAKSPNSSAPQIMKMIAAEWKKKKAEKTEK